MGRLRLSFRARLLAAAVVAILGLFCLPSQIAASASWHKILDSMYQTHQPGVPLCHFVASENLQHQIISGGRLNTRIGARHPLHELIAGAEIKWRTMVERQSTTLDSAIQEYKRRYNRSPPAGFDRWYEFAKSVNFTLIDEFDQIDRDITPLLALPGQVIKQRLRTASQDIHSYRISINQGKSHISGPLAHWEIASRLHELIRAFVKHIPSLDFHVSGHDGGPTILSEDMRLAVNSVLAKGQRLTGREVSRLEDHRRNPRPGITNACLRDPTVSYPPAPPEDSILSHTFIYDHRASMSFCTNPTILSGPTKRHGYFAYDHPRQQSASPMFVQSQLAAGGALLHPALQNYISPDAYFDKFGPIAAWKNRTEKLFWRGRTTGEWFNRTHDWRFSHRIRAHTLTTPDGNKTDPSIGPDVELLVESREPDNGVQLRLYPRDVLNEMYMDVSLIGPPVQCEESEEDHTCQDMAAALRWGDELGWEAGPNSKFLLDIDGNAWSSRFQRLLSSGAVVFKMTVFPEWNSDWLIPYYHYIPIQTDYTDLYNAFAFFRGAPDGAPGHDDLAEKIGSRAHDLTANHWRTEDMQVYVYRLLLEYARMVVKDRETMTMA